MLTEKAMAPTPVLLPRKSHGRRSLVGCSPWGHEESNTTEPLPFHFSLSCVGEGNGNPLQCSCLENPRDGEAWWAAVYGVAQSWTRLKRLSTHAYRPGYGLPWYMFLWQLKRLLGEAVCVHAKLLQSCLTLCNPVDCSPPSSSVHGILQARMLEWVAMPFSRSNLIILDSVS